MYRKLKAGKDAYITNRIIGGKRILDGNTGLAGTLDLFKLYDESMIQSEETPVELSRILIYFDLSSIPTNIDFDTFKATLKLRDVIGGQSTPANFRVKVMPLGRSFDEGRGLDISRYQDKDVCNWEYSSRPNGVPSTWASPGASASGLYEQSENNLDVFTMAFDESSLITLISYQDFVDGNEDLEVDVTNIVKMMIRNQIPNYGFRISFDDTNGPGGSYETNKFTYFVKRFASRHATNYRLTPSLEIAYNDAQFDSRSNFEFDAPATFYLKNYKKGVLGDFDDNVKLVITSTSSTFTGTYDAVKQSSGVYRASFTLSRNDFESLLVDAESMSDQYDLTFEWLLNTSNLTVHKESVSIKNSIKNENFDDIYFNIVNLRTAYGRNDLVKFRLFAQNRKKTFTPRRLPFENKSDVFETLYYSIKDAANDEVVIPFDLIGTKISIDENGMFFNMHMSDLEIGRVYTIDLKLLANGQEYVVRDLNLKFRVEA